MRAEQIGPTIAAARQHANVTQAELAAWMKVGRSYVSELEAGSAVRQLRRVLDALDVLGLELVIRPKRSR